jgi:hypothetical protein
MQDDIPIDRTAGQTERAISQKDGGSRPKVGPESEVRGGPEAPEQDLPEEGFDDAGRCSHPARR